MAELTKTVRGVDAEAYRVFRAKAVELGVSTGEALNQAIRLWVNAQNRPRLIVRADADAPATPVQAVVPRPTEQHA